MKLGELLCTEHVISEDQLQRALEIQQREHARLGEVLVELGYVTEEKVLSLVALQRGVPLLKLGYPLAPEIVTLIPRDICVQHCLIPIDRFGNQLLIAMADPLDKSARDKLAALHLEQVKFKYVLATRDDIRRAIRLYYPKPAESSSSTEAPGASAAPGEAATAARRPSPLQQHILRIAEAVERFSELRRRFREEASLDEEAMHLSSIAG